MTKLLNRIFFALLFKNGTLGHHFKSRVKKSYSYFCHEIVFNLFFSSLRCSRKFRFYVLYAPDLLLDHVLKNQNGGTRLNLPTNPFTILEPQDPEIGELYVQFRNVVRRILKLQNKRVCWAFMLYVLRYTPFLN